MQISDSTFTSNKNAIFCGQSSRLTMRRSIIEKHQTFHRDGAAVHIRSCAVQFVNCVLRDNLFEYLLWKNPGNDQHGAGALSIESGSLDMRSCHLERNGAEVWVERPGQVSQNCAQDISKCTQAPEQCLACAQLSKNATFRGASDIYIGHGRVTLWNTSFDKLGEGPWLPPRELANRQEAWIRAMPGAVLEAEGCTFGSQLQTLNNGCIIATGSATKVQFTSTSLLKCGVEWTYQGNARFGALDSSFTPLQWSKLLKWYRCTEKTSVGCDKDAVCKNLHGGGVGCSCPKNAVQLKSYGRDCRQRESGHPCHHLLLS